MSYRNSFHKSNEKLPKTVEPPNERTPQSIAAPDILTGPLKPSFLLLLEPGEGYGPWTRFQHTRLKVRKDPILTNVTMTDIYAAVLDMTTGELAIFQLKWQDFGYNDLLRIRSKATKFVERVDTWSSQTLEWIDEFGNAALCHNLRL